jgi:phosphoglycerate dehydrogenase-like enzyme
MPRPVTLLTAFTPAIWRDFFPHFSKEHFSALAERAFHVDPSAESAEAFAETLHREDPEVLVTAWNSHPLPAILPPRLRYLCHVCGTVKSLVTRAHLEQGLLVTNWGASISRTVAEGALFHIFACLRRAPARTIEMHQQGAWFHASTYTASLFERTIGIHGFGNVARELVKLVTPFSPRIRVHAPDITSANAREFGVESVSLEKLFAESDIVVELAPLIPATRGLITEKLLRSLRPGSVFVNVGRGPVVDEAALIRVAQDGEIQIGLDVFATEPLPADSPLRGLLNVSLSPHTSGPTNDRRRDAGAFALANLHAYATDAPLRAVITPQLFDLST